MTSDIAAYPLQLPRSVRLAAERLAQEDGVSLDQWIAVAVAEKIGSVDTAASFLKRKAGEAKPVDMLSFLERAADELPAPEDQRQSRSE